MAKANAAAGTTVYVPDGGPVPDLPGVRLVGPGAPAGEPESAETREPQPPVEPEPAPSIPSAEPAGRPIVNAPKADWVDYAVGQGADRDEAESLTKAELLDLYGP